MKPEHYSEGEMEPINLINKYDLCFESANALKYIARCENKGQKLEDLKKAVHYLQLRINRRGGEVYSLDLQEAYGINERLAMAAFYVLLGMDYVATDFLMQEIEDMEAEMSNEEKSKQNA